MTERRRTTDTTPTAEHRRLAEANDGTADWRRFGPYLAERQWGTVREDYSEGGTAWAYFPHDHARSRAYRWGEDGLAGFSDDRQLLCLGLALWNGRDPILKERLFGLTGQEGNHGEDVKEHYHYLDAVPSHAFQRMRYRYPQAAFPYDELVAENRARDKTAPEFELEDTGVLAGDRVFDVDVAYAKAAPDDVLIRIRVTNRGPEAAPIVVMPQIWFRNTWSWGDPIERPSLRARDDGGVDLRHPELGGFVWTADEPDRVAFCENDTNHPRLHGAPATSGTTYKDGLDRLVVHGEEAAVAADGRGTKAGAIWRRSVPAGATITLRARLRPVALPAPAPFVDFDHVLAEREREADAFYGAIHAGLSDPDARRIQRQAFAGMLWGKQVYRLDVARWLAGDPGQPEPPFARRHGRNAEWPHLHHEDVVSMPDTWEYPWYAAWDLAFHALPLAQIDPEFAKQQLSLLTHAWTMHPNGQLPAYEWAFGDVNPPVHAWAAWRVFEIDRAQHGGDGDLEFLERMLHKLLLNFTWWVNRKDAHGLNLFQGGFLGLDNVGVFDRSAPLPVDGHLEQADGTAWMAMYALDLLRIALELAQYRPVYEDVATKFFEHFLYIAGAMRDVGGHGIDLWDEEDEFFYDVLHYDDAGDGRCEMRPLKVRSLVGLIPLFAVMTLEPGLLQRLPRFHERMRWFLRHRPELAALISRWEEPGESTSGMFGGNSNWRGPVWMPMNFLLVETLRRFHAYYGDDFRVEHPTGSGQRLSLAEIADELATRLARRTRPAGPA